MGDLADRLARGERSAFAELYDACADRLHHYLLMHLGSVADADDVVQETFVRLARSRRKLRRVENLIGYVFTVARNEAARINGKRSRRQKSEETYQESIGYEPKQAWLETAEAVKHALARLPDNQREIVELKAFGGLTLREISDTLSIPPGTVATRYRTALLKLREWLASNQYHK